jgi:hypothetical protein
MRRFILMLTVSVIMAAMMVVIAMPARARAVVCKVYDQANGTC